MPLLHKVNPNKQPTMAKGPVCHSCYVLLCHFLLRMITINSVVNCFHDENEWPDKAALRAH